MFNKPNLSLNQSFWCATDQPIIAGWSSLVARRAQSGLYVRKLTYDTLSNSGKPYNMAIPSQALLGLNLVKKV